MPDRLLSLLGLSKKAGKLELGLETVTAAIKGGKTELVLCACDTGKSSRRSIQYEAGTAGVPFAVLPYSKTQLGAILGRGSPGILAITESGFAKNICRILLSEYPELDSIPTLAANESPQQTNIGKGKRRMKNESNV